MPKLRYLFCGDKVKKLHPSLNLCRTNFRPVSLSLSMASTFKWQLKSASLVSTKIGILGVVWMKYFDALNM
jgi:hypothetical protein